MTELADPKSPTVVKVELKYVRNLGNYETVAVSLGVEDATRSGETAAAAMDRVYTFVEGKLLVKMREIETVLASYNPKGKK